MEEDSIIRQKRIEYIDIFKGIGILLMVIGHVGFGKTFLHIIHSFNMPMFFFASGYLFKGDNKPSLFFRKKVKLLVFPYLITGVILYILCKAITHMPTQSLLYVLGFMHSDVLSIAGPLWFLPALFFCEMIYYLIYRITKDKGMILYSLILAITATFVITKINQTIPLSLDASCVGLGFYGAGAWYRKQNDFFNKIVSWKGVIVSGIAALIIALVNDSVNMRTSNYGRGGVEILLFWTAAFLFIFCFWTGAKLADQRYKNSLLIGKILEYFKFVSRNSLIFLCINKIVIYMIFLFFEIFSIDGIFAVFFTRIFILLVSMIIISMIAVFIKKKGDF